MVSGTTRQREVGKSIGASLELRVPFFDLLSLGPVLPSLGLVAGVQISFLAALRGGDCLRNRVSS